MRKITLYLRDYPTYGDFVKELIDYDYSGEYSTLWGVISVHGSVTIYVEA